MLKEAQYFAEQAIYWKKQNRDRYAISFYEKALEIYDKSQGYDEEKAEILFEVAHLWRFLGRTKNVGDLYLKSLSHFEKASKGQPSRNQAAVLFHLGNFLEQLFKLNIAITYYEKSLLILNQIQADSDTLKKTEAHLNKAKMKLNLKNPSAVK